MHGYFRRGLCQHGFMKASAPISSKEKKFQMLSFGKAPEDWRTPGRWRAICHR
jgi:hypothetical protein